jgi:glycosyltransferase involved in cell wall biosynthesis
MGMLTKDNDQSMQQDAEYRTWIRRMASRRAEQYAGIPERGLLSFVTSAYNTPLEFLRAMAESVLQQDFGLGETVDWVIVDNGSTIPETIAYIDSLRRHDFVNVIRISENAGILGGIKVAAENANGRYILPLDSDDYRSPDCVRIVTHYIQTKGYPALLYSDEDKLDGTDFFEPYLKPDWDPVLFMNSCYIAHLCVVDRALAGMLGAYSDNRVKGCHDWDTFMRFYLAGYEPVHIPEVLYSWRLHEASCSGNIASKDYIHESHQACLARFVEAQGSDGLYYLDYSPLFNRSPDWWIRRRVVPGKPFLPILLDEPGGRGSYSETNMQFVQLIPADENAGALLDLLKGKRCQDCLVHLRGASCEVLHADWESEALALFELFRDTAVVGGPLYDATGVVLCAGIYFGCGDGAGSPDRGRPKHDPGYFAQMWKQHSVSAVRAHNIVVSGAFLLDALTSGRIPSIVPLRMLGEWLGATALNWGKRVIYSPFLGVQGSLDWERLVGPEDRVRFLETITGLMPDQRYYSKHLDLRLERPYMLADPNGRYSNAADAMETTRSFQGRAV